MIAKIAAYDRFPAASALVDYLRRPDSSQRRRHLSHALLTCTARGLLVVQDTAELTDLLTNPHPTKGTP